MLGFIFSSSYGSFRRPRESVRKKSSSSYARETRATIGISNYHQLKKTLEFGRHIIIIIISGLVPSPPD
ncbi:hypothetical protein K1719_038368 [Acacia pycnantha]|nr:hypothetical protein K1719_038368 [Acacia pycnantha]